MAASVTAFHVKDGDHVEKGHQLVEFDATAAIADRAVIRSKVADLKAEVARRETAIAAVQIDPIPTDAAIIWRPDVSDLIRARENGVLRADLSQIAAVVADLQAQRSAKLTAQARYAASITAEKSLIAARTERTSMREQLADKGWDSRSKVLNALEPLRKEQVALATLQGTLDEATASVSVLEAKIVQSRRDFISLNTQKAAAASRLLDDLAQQSIKADQAVANMSLTSPITGVVHALALTSLGQAVRPGQQVMRVVPDGSPVSVVAYVLNTDIGFVHEGQRAIIKVDAFPSTRYGAIEGHVGSIAADAVPGGLALAQQRNGSLPETQGSLSATTSAQQTSDLVFPVTIIPDRNTIMVNDRAVVILPGMSVAVEIDTEHQRVIDYIFSPLARAVPQRVL